MNKLATAVLISGAIAFGASVAAASVQAPQTERTPKGWNYDIRDGQRIPKSNRVTNPDGSWREELKQGNCVTVKQKSATGEYKESRECNRG